LKRFEIIFQFPVGWKRGDLRSLSYAARLPGIMKLCWATALVQVLIGWGKKGWSPDKLLKEQRPTRLWELSVHLSIAVPLSRGL